MVHKQTRGFAVNRQAAGLKHNLGVVADNRKNVIGDGNAGNGAALFAVGAGCVNAEFFGYKFNHGWFSLSVC
jgi:hypothetical protein